MPGTPRGQKYEKKMILFFVCVCKSVVHLRLITMICIVVGRCMYLVAVVRMLRLYCVEPNIVVSDAATAAHFTYLQTSTFCFASVV